MATNLLLLTAPPQLPLNLLPLACACSTPRPQPPLVLRGRPACRIPQLRRHRLREQLLHGRLGEPGCAESGACAVSAELASAMMARSSLCMTVLPDSKIRAVRLPTQPLLLTDPRTPNTRAQARCLREAPPRGLPTCSMHTSTLCKLDSYPHAVFRSRLQNPILPRPPLAPPRSKFCNQNSNQCCQSSQFSCGNTCCALSNQQCDPVTQACCPTGSVKPSGGCCPAGQSPCGSGCCECYTALPIPLIAAPAVHIG